MNTLYVIRWTKEIDGEFECGNLAFGETEERKAISKMLEDMDKTHTYVDDGIDEVETSFEYGENENEESCNMIVTHAGSGDMDIYNWWIDKITFN